MKKLFWILICIGIWASAKTAGAQIRLGLDDALELALNENPTIRIAQTEIERYDYVKRQTWGQLLPQVTLSGQVNHTFIKQNMSKGFSLGGDQYTNIAAAVDVTLPLFAPGVYRTLKMNRTQMEAAVEQARSTRLGLIAEVRKAFYNILLAEQSLAVLRESQATMQRTVDDTRVQYENGLASEYDLLTARVQLSNIRPTILQTENSVTIAKRMLKMLLSIPEQVTIEVTGRLDDLRTEVLADRHMSDDVSGNSDLRSLELQEELLTRQLRVANASRWPTIGLFGNFTLMGNNMGSFNMHNMNVVQDGYYWQHPLYAGVRMSVPLFAGLTKSNKAREIRNRIAQLSLQRRYTEERIRVEVHTALNNLLTAREQMKAQELTVEQAAKAYKISDTRYRAGAGTILELNSAQLSQTRAQLNFSQAIFDFLSAKADYDRIAGIEYTPAAETHPGTNEDVAL